jgi:hypothetical protein
MSPGSGSVKSKLTGQHMNDILNSESSTVETDAFSAFRCEVGAKCGGVGPQNELGEASVGGVGTPLGWTLRAVCGTRAKTKRQRSCPIWA